MGQHPSPPMARKSFTHLLPPAFSALVLGISLTPASLRAQEGEECLGNEEWLRPMTANPALGITGPPSHAAGGGDCPFYQLAWRTFLYVTQPDGTGRPAFAGFPNIDSTFEHTTVGDLAAKSTSSFLPNDKGVMSLAPRVAKGANDSVHVGAGVNQAGTTQGLLIDQRGQPIFYGIHFNDLFADFIRKNGLTTRDGILAADPKLQFEQGCIELKSAWQIVSSDSPPSNFITVQAELPMLKVVKDSNGKDKVVVDTIPRPQPVTVALISLHVVFTLKDHPEFIWSTFEHVDSSGKPDCAPSSHSNPEGDEGHDANDLPDRVVGNEDLLLFKAGTKYNEGNKSFTPEQLAAALDEQKQTFTKGGRTLQTSIFREYPGSKTHTNDFDEDIVDLNDSMTALFEANRAKGADDKRRFYRLVGAVWLETPANFKEGLQFQNTPEQNSDTPGAALAGEDALSSVAMESFTQNKFAATGMHNCFMCHDTRQVVSDVTGHRILPPKRINVSHVLSKFVMDTTPTNP